VRYRARSTSRRHAGGLVTIVVLLGLLGGLALGALAAARRTQSSFAAFMRSTNPSDLVIAHNDSGNDSNASDAAFLRAVNRLPHVRHVESADGISELVLGPDGFPANDPRPRLFDSSVETAVDISGEFFDQDRLAVLHGRRIDPRHRDEIEMTSGAADVLHLHVGDIVPFGIYTNAQTTRAEYGTAKQVPKLRANLKVVGIVDAMVRRRARILDAGCGGGPARAWSRRRRHRHRPDAHRPPKRTPSARVESSMTSRPSICDWPASIRASMRSSAPAT
jgi:hypothetical protein